jgi:hypothetical protein
MNDSAYMTRYLLGELSEDEQAALEERYAADPRIFDEVVKAESDLVDDYVRRKLAPAARERFERFYLAHPQRRERVKFAEALVTRLDRMEAPAFISAAPSAGTAFAWRTRLDRLLRPKPALGFALATLVIASGIWLVFEARRTREAVAHREAARSEQERRDSAANARAAAEKARVDRAAAARPATVSVLALSVGSGTRAVDTSSPTPLVIPPGTTEVRLQLSLLQQQDYSSYRVILRSVGGAEILRREQLTSAAAGSGALITLSVQASQFESGDYILTLQGASGGGGFEDLSRSLVRVDKR